MSQFSKVEVFQSIGAQLGEGPMWHPNRKTVWWIDINGQEYFEAKLDGTPARRLKSSQKIGAVVPTASGGLLAALQDGIYRVDPGSGASTLWVKAPGHDAREFRFNDGKVDPRGRFWAGTLALDDRRGQSRLYRFDSDRSVATMREGVSISNGIAWSPDGGTMYYIDSPERTVQSFAYDIERGTISSPRIAIELTEADGWPDGCSMDAEGMLWVAHWGAAKVTRWDPRSARLLSTLKLPVQNVTSCAFAGPGLDELFITTAKEAARAALEPEAGFIFRHRPGVAGLPLANFAGA